MLWDCQLVTAQMFVSLGEILTKKRYFQIDPPHSQLWITRKKHRNHAIGKNHEFRLFQLFVKCVHPGISAGNEFSPTYLKLNCQKPTKTRMEPLGIPSFCVKKSHRTVTFEYSNIPWFPTGNSLSWKLRASRLKPLTPRRDELDLDIIDIICARV